MSENQSPTALVTGASTGIGKAVALELARLGMHPLLVARRHELLIQLQSEIESAGGTASVFPCDVTDEASVKTHVNEIRSLHPRIDLLVNNAGKELISPLQIQKSNTATEMMDLNVVAMAMYTRACLRLLGEGSAIVNMASVAALKGAPGMSLYAASKGAVIAFTRAIALELAAKRIRVNAVAPGIVRTEMTDRMFAKYAPSQVEQLESTYPLGFGRPADVAKAVAFLGGQDAAWITGQTLIVDGGYSA